MRAHRAPARYAERPMCNKCDEIIETIARYRRLREQINDQQTRQAVESLMAALVAKKLALHTERTGDR